MKKLFKQFSFPGGIPSHVAPETPGSIHEGGELGYSLSHAFGAAFDNPDLIVACVVGDGEAETGPLATSWHSQQVPQPGARRRRPADPPPERLQDRQPDRPGPHRPRRAGACSCGATATRRYFVEGHEPEAMHRLMAATLDRVVAEIRPHPGRRPGAGRHRAAALADDRPQDAQGLDRPQGGRRPAGRGDVPGAPGAALRADRASRAPQDPRGLDAELPARGAVRRERAGSSPSCRSWPPRASAGWGPTRTPTAASCSATCGCPTSATTPSTCPGRATS